MKTKNFLFLLLTASCCITFWYLKTLNVENSKDSTHKRKVTLYVVRHGERQDFLEREKVQHHKPKEFDSSLSKLGMKQAEEVATHLKTRITNRNVLLLVSPYLRTMQTAFPIATQLGLKMKIEPGIMESNGERIWKQEKLPKFLANDGSSEALTSFAFALEHIDRDYKTVIDFEEYYVKGRLGKTENRDELQKRWVKTIEEVVMRSIKDIEGDELVIIAVSHASPIIMGVSGLVGVNPMTFKVKTGVCSISHLEKHMPAEEGVTWALRENGATAHLSSGEMYHYEIQFETNTPDA